MNTVSSIASSTAYVLVDTSRDTGKTAVGKDTPVTASPEPQISPQARVLAEFYEAASAFVQKEHLKPFTGWKYDSAGYVLNNESGYLDIEKYNNYLFDKAATTLVEQAGRLGLTLDKNEALAQLKADNADIAAIKYSDSERVKYLKMCQEVCYSNLSYSEVNSLTDMYIKAKENGLDARQVGDVAFWLGIYNGDRKSDIIFLELYTIPGMFSFTAEELAAHEVERFASFQDRIDMAGELKAKLPNVSFGFDDENGFFEQLLNPRMSNLDRDTLNFLTQMADLYAPGATPNESWSWSPATGWTTDPDSPQAAAARAVYQGWLEKTAAFYQEHFGDKTGDAARVSGKTDRFDLEKVLANIDHERKLRGQLLRSIPRLTDAYNDKQSPFPAPGWETAILAPDIDWLQLAAWRTSPFQVR
ncbi:MAG: hypothetical protein LBU43_06390 [Candidatus Accumulibacter sp.]|nr:hypothetical protein [Accumulibacter sp.]